MSSEKEETTKNIARYFVNTGIILVFVSFAIFVVVFAPVIKQEIKYLGRKSSSISEVVLESTSTPATTPENASESSEDGKIIPVDKEFGLVVPKIGANSKVIQDVDPYNSKEYQQKLTQGVAHAKGTSLPGQAGNTFLFAHSSDNFYNANRYNSVFYLLNKLVLEDNFYLVKDGRLYEYSVTEKSVVEPDQVQYLTDKTITQKATLMTCWPPGTTLKRLILIGDLVSVTKP